MTDHNKQSAVVLVTGASGYIGSHIVSRLVADGMRVKALSRNGSADSQRLPEAISDVNVDVTDETSLAEVFKGVDYVIHTAAGMDSSQASFDTTVTGTRNVLNCCLKFGVKRLVHISSLSVYDIVGHHGTARIDEESSLEPTPSRRGMYSWAKTEADRLIVDLIDNQACPVVCLRPGLVIGDGRFPVSPQVGIEIGDRIILALGNRNQVLPFVDVQYVAEIAVAALSNPNAAGQVFNLIDPSTITRGQYLKFLVSSLQERTVIIALPFLLLRLLVPIQSALLRALGRQPWLTSYRLVSSLSDVRFDASKALKVFGAPKLRTASELINRTYQ